MPENETDANEAFDCYLNRIRIELVILSMVWTKNKKKRQIDVYAQIRKVLPIFLFLCFIYEREMNTEFIFPPPIAQIDNQFESTIEIYHWAKPSRRSFEIYLFSLLFIVYSASKQCKFTNPMPLNRSFV